MAAGKYHLQQVKGAQSSRVEPARPDAFCDKQWRSGALHHGQQRRISGGSIVAAPEEVTPDPLPLDTTCAAPCLTHLYGPQTSVSLDTSSLPNHGVCSCLPARVVPRAGRDHGGGADKVPRDRRSRPNDTGTLGKR